jgi:lipid-A-disaccharide synthase
MVKRSKPSQDLRVDMPAIGPDTITRVVATGLDGIALEAGKVLVAQRAEVIERANSGKVFVAGVRDETATEDPPHQSAAGAAFAFRRLGAIEPTSHVLRDAALGTAVLRSLRPFAPAGKAVVVVRNHVLAVEAGEGALATLERAANLKQWASLTHSRRGMVVVAYARDLTPALIARIDSAGYAGAIAMDPTEAAPDMQDAIRAADKARVCVLSTVEGVGENA